MKFLARLFLFLCLPGMVWHAPLKAEYIPANVESTQGYFRFSPWDLLKYENLSYDRIMNFIYEIEYGNILEKCTERQFCEIQNFIIFLARNGISDWNTEAKEQLEKDIKKLLSDDDDNDLEEKLSWWWSNFNDYQGIMIKPAILGFYDKPQGMLCKNWIGKKWKKTKNFVKNHKKAVIIATVVVVAATVVIIATSGAAAGPILAGGAAATGTGASEGSNASSSDDKEKRRTPVNKPGELQSQEDHNSPILPKTQDTSYQDNYAENNDPKDTYIPQKESIPKTLIPVKETIVQQSEEIKAELSEIVPGEAFNIPKKDEPSFWAFAAEKARETGSHITHEVYDVVTDQLGLIPDITGAFSEKLPEAFQVTTPFDKDPREAHQEMVEAGHEKIDEIFGTEQADMYAAEGKEVRGELTTGMLPPPGAIGKTAKAPSKAYEIAKNGGKHAKMLSDYSNKPIKEIQKGIKSYEKQIAIHKDKIARPSNYCPDWDKLDLRQREALINKKWPSDIKGFEEQKEILRSILDEK